jgi:phage terminase large subunit GpA-like protein
MLEDAGIKTLSQLERDIPTWINTLKQTIDILKDETEVEIKITFRKKDATTNQTNISSLDPNSTYIRPNH